MNSRSPPEKTTPRNPLLHVISPNTLPRHLAHWGAAMTLNWRKNQILSQKAPIHDQDSWAWLLADGQIKYFTSLTMVLFWGSITRALPHPVFLYFCIVWIFNHLYYICNLTSGVCKDIPKTLRNTILVTQKSMMLVEHRRELLNQILTSTIFPSPSASLKLLRNAESHTNPGPAASNSAL